jgi:4-hydroxybenzoate polyprenyltransferase
VIPSPRVQWQVRNRKLLAFLFIAGLAGSVFFFTRISTFWPWLLPAVLATFLYSAPKLPHSLFQRLRKVAIGKTIFLAFIWTYVTSVLPVIVSGESWSEVLTIYAISRYFFIYCICILFDYRDREDDKAEGVRSLITFLNDRNITRLFIFSFLVYITFTFLLLNYGFSRTQILLLLVPGVILAFLFNPARRNFSDWLYYVVLDGLMALSAILLLVARI